MKYFLLISFINLSLSATFAQKFEIGAGAGVCHYKGDIAPTFKPFQFGPGGNLFFRYNHSRALSAKVGGLFGEIHAKDENNRRDLFLQKRNWDFQKTIMEGSFQVEYNFLNFRTNQSRIISNWTPYVFGGGTFLLPQRWGGYSIGVGLKKEWKKQWNWGVEFGTRKLLNGDFLDDYGYYSGTNAAVTKGTPSNPATTTMQGDLYYYTNFSISYVFYKVYCPNPK